MLCGQSNKVPSLCEMKQGERKSIEKVINDLYIVRVTLHTTLEHAVGTVYDV